MCDILTAILSFFVNLIANFSEEISGQINDAGLGFLSENFGCEIS